MFSHVLSSSAAGKIHLMLKPLGFSAPQKCDLPALFCLTQRENLIRQMKKTCLEVLEYMYE